MTSIKGGYVEDQSSCVPVSVDTDAVAAMYINGRGLCDTLTDGL